jgi:hypothetical protein
LAMKSPTQSVRYRVRRAGATPSGRARSIGRGCEDCQGSGCFSTDPAKAYKYGSDEERTFRQRRASALARRCRHRISPVGDPPSSRRRAVAQHTGGASTLRRAHGKETVARTGV